MAKIAIIAAFAAAGAVTGGLAWVGSLGFGIGGPSIFGGLALGAAVGAQVGQPAEGLMFPVSERLFDEGDENENPS